MKKSGKKWDNHYNESTRSGILPRSYSDSQSGIWPDETDFTGKQIRQYHLGVQRSGGGLNIDTKQLPSIST